MLAVGRVPARLLILDNIVDLAEVDSKVAVQVYSLINVSGGTATDLCEVLAPRNDLVVGGPVIFDRSHTIDIEDWHIVILVLLQHFLVPCFFPHVTEPNRLQHLKGR
jgi:hypothetical protein